MTTTTTTGKISITMSERGPVRIVTADWPCIASASWYSGQHACQANEVAKIKVRQHDDGRTIVYGWCDRGPGGMPLGYRSRYHGYQIGRTGEQPSREDMVRAIRRVAGAIDQDHLAGECIGDLPAEDLT